MNELLQNLEKLMWLGAHVKELIATNTERDIYHRGQYLWEAGKPCNSLYFIKKGIIRHYFCEPNGKEHTLRFIKGGGFITDTESFGCLSVSSTSALCVTDTELIILNEAALQRLETHITRWDKLLKKLIDKIKNERNKENRKLGIMNEEEKMNYMAISFPEIFPGMRSEDLSSYLNISIEKISFLQKEAIMNSIGKIRTIIDPA